MYNTSLLDCSRNGDRRGFEDTANSLHHFRPADACGNAAPLAPSACWKVACEIVIRIDQVKIGYRGIAPLETGIDIQVLPLCIILHQCGKIEFSGKRCLSHNVMSLDISTHIFHLPCIYNFSDHMYKVSIEFDRYHVS